ncbi:hypothetical protein ACLOJK_004875 [Asimina triloba]
MTLGSPPSSLLTFLTHMRGNVKELVDQEGRRVSGGKWKEAWTLLPRGVDGQIWLEGVERADAAGHGRVAWSCLDWMVLLAGWVGWIVAAGVWMPMDLLLVDVMLMVARGHGRRRRGGQRWVGRFGVASRR